MKSIRKTLFSVIILAGLQLALSSCVGEAGVGYDDGVGYGGGPWFHDDIWLDGGGRGWYGGHGDRGGYIHPGGGRGGGSRH